jgi:hypothetical protein
MAGDATRGYSIRARPRRLTIGEHRRRYDIIGRMQWDKVEPILRATYAQLEDRYMTTGDAVIEAAGCSEDEARIAFDALRKSGYITVQAENAAGIPFMIEAAPLGLQACSGWPSDSNGAMAFVDALVRAAEARADDPATPEDERAVSSASRPPRAA